MANGELQFYLARWRKAEDRFYASVMSAPELYTTAIHLVRALADHIKVERVDDLPEAYTQFTIAQVAQIADETNLPQRDFLDYNLARDAAFYLRHRDILETKAKSEVRQRIIQARARNETWVELYNNEHEGQGVTFFQRLEMHLSDGLGIYTALELDWEKGRVYVVEPLVLDPDTGEPRREVKPPDPRQEFSTREEMMLTLAALRRKYD